MAAEHKGLGALVVMPGSLHAAPAHDPKAAPDASDDAPEGDDYDQFKGACDDMVDALGLDLDDDAKSKFCDAFKHAFALADKAEDAEEEKPEEKAKDTEEY